MRIVDRDKLDKYLGMPCAACGSISGTVAHHIKTVGSGGDDVDDNLLCLCPKHHNEIHMKGTRMFAAKYLSVAAKLRSKGWEQDGDGIWKYYPF